jgi:rhomboid protease GluP
MHLEEFTDYSKLTEFELAEVFSRIDPRFSAERAAKVKELLIQRGYVVHDGIMGPGSVVPSPEKLQELIGSPRLIECSVTYGPTGGLLDRFRPALNDFGLTGSGTLTFDGIHLMLSGPRSSPWLGFLVAWSSCLEIARRRIVDVELQDTAIHLVERMPDSDDRHISLWLPDRDTAERLVNVLPKDRSTSFQPQLPARATFALLLNKKASRTPATVGLVALNVLMFIAMVVARADWLRPDSSVRIMWGSNFGPFTTAGDWWRLVTALFVHFGLIHLAFNMWALIIVGPLIERLYSSSALMFIYVVGGIFGNLVSISWEPAVNTAGASTAIFALFGAFFAALLFMGKTFPSSVARPLAKSMLIFSCGALLAGFARAGIDNAAHLGGLMGGFLIGISAVRPLTADAHLPSARIRIYAQAIGLSAVLVMAGSWVAVRSSTNLAGEGLYWHTMHWFLRRAPSFESEFNLALAHAKSNPRTAARLADKLENDIIPFWHELSVRASDIVLVPGSANQPRLEVLQAIANDRAQGFKLLDDGLRRNDGNAIVAANQHLKAADDIIHSLGPTNKSSLLAPAP